MPSETQKVRGEHGVGANQEGESRMRGCNTENEDTDEEGRVETNDTQIVKASRNLIILYLPKIIHNI